MAKRHIAGVMLILSALLGMVTTALLFMAAESTTYEYFAQEYMMYGALNLIFSIGALVGAIYALSGTSWALSIAGSILGILVVGPIFLGSLCGLVALILVAISKDEYDQVRRERDMLKRGELVYVDEYGEPIEPEPYYEHQPYVPDDYHHYGDDTHPGYRPPPF